LLPDARDRQKEKLLMMNTVERKEEDVAQALRPIAFAFALSYALLLGAGSFQVVSVLANRPGNSTGGELHASLVEAPALALAVE
jgi:hypothetical protein